MPMSSAPSRRPGRLTEAEYLRIERAAPFKSEFFNGEMFAMAGGTPMHSLIAANLIVALGNRLRSRGCHTFTSDLRLKVEMSGLYTYPDVSVVCGEMKFSAPEQDCLLNPTLLAEVLSESTEGYDRGTKFEHYRRIPSLQAYLLVSQHKPSVDLFLRGHAAAWVLSEAHSLESSIEIPPLNMALPLSELFSGVHFPPAELRPGTDPPGP
jgi:Uma2 family endonuclease